jgi:hypothetical protein
MPTLTGPSSTSQDITMASAGADVLTYTTVATGSVLPASMQLYVDGVETAGVTLPSKYIGQSFTFTKAGGQPISGVFAEGAVYLVSSTTTATPTTTGAPSNSQGYVPNTDGYSSTVNVYHISGTSNDNNGGVIKNGGNVANIDLFASAPVVHDNEREVMGSVVLDNSWANKAVNDGTFAHNTQRPIAKKVTITLGGVANTVLRSGAARPELVKSINKLETLRTRRFTTAIRENKYNRYTGQFDAGYPVVNVDALSTDNAANPSRTLPGQLVFKTGAKVPVSSDYKPKTN